MKKVVLIRHGESLGQIANKSGISRRDPSLTDCFLSPKGIQQAKELRTDAALKNIDLIWFVQVLLLEHSLLVALRLAIWRRNNVKLVHTQQALFTTSFVVHADICEVGGRIPENQGRPIESIEVYTGGIGLDFAAVLGSVWFKLIAILFLAILSEDER